MQPLLTGSIRLRYFLRIPNVGDRVNPLIASALAGMDTRLTLDDALPHLLAVGSLMSCSQPTSLIWGTGIMHPELGIGSPTASSVFALRGKLSFTALRDAGVQVRDVPLGDPGLLAPALLGIRAAPRPRHELGVVAHYVDRFHPDVRRLLATPGVFDLDVRGEPKAFLEAMAECRCVASSSLHGLIFAEALGIPSVWFRASSDVAGHGFKFHDWFTTTRHPQRDAVSLVEGVTPKDLVRQAEVRQSTVSPSDLIAAFPQKQLEETRDPRPCRVSVAVARQASTPLPVFVISFNRGKMLLRCLASLRHFNRPTVPIIHDNGSTDPFTLRVLDDLESQGLTVFRHRPITHPDELNLVDRTVQEFFCDWGEPSRYVVTDCDIDMSIAAPDTIEVYDEVLNAFRAVGCVGPMLRIRDICSSHPLYARIMNRHIDQFWSHRPTWIQTSTGRIAVQECSIDTTFALHRAGDAFHRLKTAVRVYEPYEALHLDWYEDTRSLDPFYPHTSRAGISHWNNTTEESLHGHDSLRFDRFFAVRRTPWGHLEEYECDAAPASSTPSRPPSALAGPDPKTAPQAAP